MKNTTKLALAATILGLLVIAYLATRPRPAAIAPSPTPGEGAQEGSEASRAITAFGTAATGFAAGIAELA